MTSNRILLLLYKIFFHAAIPWLIFHAWRRSRNTPHAWRRISERLGMASVPPKFVGGIWVHTVSVGEFNAALTLIKRLLQQYPNIPLTITTTTATGSTQVQKVLGDKVFHVYAPWDLPFAINRFLDDLKPRMSIILETELWPCWFDCLYQRHIPLVIANGRLSQKAATRYQKIKGLLPTLWQAVSVIATQAASDAEWFSVLGMPRERIKITGNLKFEQTIPPHIFPQAQAWRANWGALRPVFLAASTHAFEEEIVLEAFSKIRDQIPDCLLLLVLRHPNRVPEVVPLLKSYRYKKRSEGDADTNTDIYVGDTIGELLTFYAACDVAFVAGSLMPIGGHNLLEPAAIGIAALTGPQFFNMKDITEQLIVAGAVEVITDATSMCERVLYLLQNPEVRTQMGNAGRTLVEHNQGAVDRHLQLIGDLL